MGEELIPENSTIFLCKCTDTSVTQDSAYSVPTPFRFRNHGDFRSFPFSSDGLVLNTTGFDPSLFFNYIFYIHVFISVWIMASRKKKQQNRQKKKNYFSSFYLIYRHQFVDEESIENMLPFWGRDMRIAVYDQQKSFSFRESEILTEMHTRHLYDLTAEIHI